MSMSAPVTEDRAAAVVKRISRHSKTSATGGLHTPVAEFRGVEKLLQNPKLPPFAAAAGQAAHATAAAVRRASFGRRGSRINRQSRWTAAACDVRGAQAVRKSGRQDQARVSKAANCSNCCHGRVLYEGGVVGTGADVILSCLATPGFLTAMIAGHSQCR